MINAESTETLYKLYENCDPDLLKSTRQAVGMDDGVLARTACLSIAQVRQLESGGDGLFYSITIKRQAYKRVMMILGASPPTHVPVAEALATPASNDAPSQDTTKDTIDSIVALSSKSDYLGKRPLVDFFVDMRYRLMTYRQVVGASLLALVAAGLLVFNWPRNAADVTSSVTPSEMTEPKPKAEPVSLAVEEKPPETTAHVVQPAAITASVPVASSNSCTYVQADLPEVMPISASKAANYVYVQSPIDTEVCLVDGAKRAALLRLHADEGRSVYGTPPWQIGGAALSELQIYAQGVRVRAPEGAGTRFMLIERPVTP